MQNRIVSFDVLKLLAIFFVIWGHSIQQFQSTPTGDAPVFRYIYAFHMPLFMMISGYFSVSSMSLKPKDFIFKKFQQLIYPCIVWGLILWIVIESLHSFRYGHNEISIMGLLEDFYWLADFWFLKSCFICYILTYFARKICKTSWIIVSLIISQIISPFFVSFMYPCFLVGIILKEYEKIMFYLTRHSVYIIIVFIIMLIYWDGDAWKYSHVIPSGIDFMNASQVTTILFYRLFRMTIGIIGGLALITMFARILGNHKHSGLINICSDWGRYTLEVYILQAILLEKLLSLYLCLDGINFLCFNFIVTPLISIAMLSVCIAIAKLLNSSNILKKILWGK